jgi:hypothetical protein
MTAPLHTVASFARPIEVRHHHTPRTAVAITKAYTVGETCAAHHCRKPISDRFPCLEVETRGHCGGRRIEAVHDRCLGRYLLDDAITNEGDTISGLVHQEIVTTPDS